MLLLAKAKFTIHLPKENHTMFRRIALLIMLLCAFPAFAQFANITNTGITDASGAVLVS
jgi:hypothetical protein